MGRPKKNKLEELTQTDGRVSSPIPTTLEAILHEGGIGKYSDISEADYEKKVIEMNKPELESLAHELGVMIVDDVVRLRNNLIREFKSYHLARSSPYQPVEKRTKPLSKEAQSILNEGK